MFKFSDAKKTKDTLVKQCILYVKEVTLRHFLLIADVPSERECCRLVFVPQNQMVRY